MWKIVTGKRNSEDNIINGKYLFFDRSTKIKKINSYFLSGEWVIIAGEGDFTPRYINDKFDIHQRVYAIQPDNMFFLTKYVFYHMVKNKNYFLKSAVGSTVKSLRRFHFENYKILFIPLRYQQHIIGIIEPFEKLQETYSLLIKQILKLMLLISNSFSLPTNEKLTKYFNFIKGIEIPDSKRINYNKEGFTRYIRVGDLLSNTERQPLYCYFENKKLICNYKDILIATDGEPGRIKTGLNGVFSSSIRKLESKNDKELSIALLNLLNNYNKELFSAYTTGTTIKHGGTNAIKYLAYFEYNENIKIISNYLYQLLTLLQNSLVKINQLKTDLINKLVK